MSYLRNGQKLKVVFLGTPEFCLPTLDILSQHPVVDLLYIVSQPSKPVGRGYKMQNPPVVDFALQKDLPILQTENINHESDFLKLLTGSKIDIIIVLAFAQFLGNEILKIPSLGCFNIHTSLLPKYRGAAPIQMALLKGDHTTGVSIQKMVKRMDAGDIVHQEKLLIESFENAGILSTRLKFLAALATSNFLSKIFSDQLTFTPQDENLVSFAPTIKKEDGLIDFKMQEAQEILNRIRAFHPWPGVFCFLNGKRLKIIKAQNSSKNLAPAVLDTKFGELIVGCKIGSLRLTHIQLEGKKACSDVEFLRGMREEPKIT